jgi:hypothetical protein
MMKPRPNLETSSKREPASSTSTRRPSSSWIRTRRPKPKKRKFFGRFFETFFQSALWLSILLRLNAKLSLADWRLRFRWRKTKKGNWFVFVFVCLSVCLSVCLFMCLSLSIFPKCFLTFDSFEAQCKVKSCGLKIKISLTEDQER